MPLDVLVPDLLLPSGAPPALRGLRLRSLERWLARADVATSPSRSASGWLAERFGLASPPPLAAVSLAGDDAPRDGTWLRVDPVHFLVDRDGATLHHTAILDVTREEADLLIDALQAHFAPDGLRFVAPVPQRWYVRVPEAETPVTTALDEAVGRDVLHLLPRGSGRIHWPAAFTEAQMVLGAHEVNARREERGNAPINSVWFWGEGAAPSTVAKPYERIHSDDVFARGLARLSGATLAPAASAASAIEATAEPVLATLDGLVAPWHRGDANAWKDAAANLDAAWFGQLGDAIKRFGEVRIILPSEGGTRVASLTPASRWRWFRASRPLAHA